MSWEDKEINKLINISACSTLFSPIYHFKLNDHLCVLLVSFLCFLCFFLNKKKKPIIILKNFFTINE